MKREEVKKLYNRVCDAYPNFKPNNPQFTFDLWVEFLKNYDFTEVEIYLDEHIRSCEYAPSISQLVSRSRSNTKNFSNERNYSEKDYEEMERAALQTSLNGWGQGNE